MTTKQIPTQAEVEQALIDMVDGYHAHDIMGHTGLPLDRCEEIQAVFSKLMAYRGANPKLYPRK